MLTAPTRDPRRALRLTLFTSVLLVATAGPSAGQAPVQLRLGAFVSAHLARGALPLAPILSSPTNVVSYADVPTLPSLGIGVEGRPGGLPVSLRATILRSLSRTEVGTWGCADADGGPLPCPSILIEVPTDIATTTGALDALVDVPVGRMSVRPLIGLAWLRYAYEWDPAPVGAFALDPGRVTSDAAALHYGLGLAMPLAGLRLEAEYSEYRSRDDRLRPGSAGLVTVGASILLG